MLYRKISYISEWEFKPVRIRTTGQGGAKTQKRQTYACKAGVTQVPVKTWARFLTNFWESHDLDAGARLLHVRSVDDLSAEGAALLQRLRDNHEALLLDENAPLLEYINRLKKMYQLGMLNFSLELMGSRNTPACQLKATHTVTLYF